MKQVHGDNLKRAPLSIREIGAGARDGPAVCGATHGAKYVGEGQKNNSSDVSFENK